jgi:hypothetical protein
MAAEGVDGGAMAADQARVVERNPGPSAQRRIQLDGRLLSNGNGIGVDGQRHRCPRPTKIQRDAMTQPRWRRHAVV